MSLPLFPSTWMNEEHTMLQDSVRRGEFASESDALVAAAKAWEKQRTLETIRERIRLSIEDPRPSIPIDEVEAHLERYMAERQ